MNWNEVISAGIGFTLGLLVMTGLMLPDKRAIEQQEHVDLAALELQTERIVFYEDLLLKIFPAIPDRTYSLDVTVTAYTARQEECDATPWVTADMTLSRVGLLAVSRDLLNEVGLRYGDVVILEGLGIFKVRDTMNERFKRRVDILMAHPEAAKKFGVRTATLTWVRS